MTHSDNTKGTIVVDGRVYSSEAHDRGMGRYVSFLIQTAASAGYEICLLLYKNTNLKADDPLRKLCKSIEYIDIDPATYNEKDIHNCSYSIEKIAKKNQATAYLDATPFLFPSRLDITECPVIAVAYDLIPLRHPKQYFAGQPSVVTDLYENGLRRLINADSVIAISNYTKGVISEYLGIEQKRIGVIYPRLDDNYLGDSSNQDKSLDYFAILGGHFSKNPKFSLELFNQLNGFKKYTYSISVPTKGQLNYLRSCFPSLTSKLTIRTSIEEHDKIISQERAKVVFHLSRDEGFGIPLLEALFKKSRTVCCDIKINREILEKSGESYDKIALLISTNSDENYLSNIVDFIKSPETNETKRLFNNIRKYFIEHWTKEAPIVLEKAISTAKENSQKFLSELVAKMVCNTPSKFCGVADFAYSIPYGVNNKFLVYTLDSEAKKMHALGNIRLKSHLCFPDDLKIAVPTIFHLAISDRLWFGVELLREHGSSKDIVILHDHIYLYGLYHFHNVHKKMDDFFKHYFVGPDTELVDKIDLSGYISFEEFNKLTENYCSTWLRQKNARLINHLTKAAENEHRQFCQGTISLDKEYVEIGIDDRALPVTVRLGEKWRSQKKFSHSDLVIGTFGSVTNNKFIAEISDAVSRACKKIQSETDQENLRIHFVLCGIVHDQAVFNQAKAHFEKLGLNPFFHYANPPSDLEFDAIMSASDIIISCRKQDRGQLSHIIPRSLSMGKPLLANSRSGYSMIQEDCLIDDDNFENDLFEKLLFLSSNRENLHSISHFNRSLFSKKHNMPHYLDKILTSTGNRQ